MVKLAPLTSLIRAMSVTRRFVLTSIPFAFGPAPSRAGDQRSIPEQRQRSQQAMKKVARWGCQYQQVDLAAIASSNIDLIVIDPSLDDSSRRFVTQAECGTLKAKSDGSRRIVLAYLSVGEADTKRWYWPEEWRRSAPDWVGPENARWPGSRSVRYWNSEWRDLVYHRTGSMLDQILDVGFDGVFLDRMDGYGDWPGEAGAKDAMVELVVELAAKARAKRPGFILMMQNAEALLPYADLTNVIDAHNKESLLTGLPDPNSQNSPQDVEWSLSYLRRLQQLGMPTFATEYVSDQTLRLAVRRRLTQLGFVAFFATFGLDRLPGADGEAEN